MPQEKVQDYWIEDSVKDKSFEEHYVLGKELEEVSIYCLMKF